MLYVTKTQVDRTLPKSLINQQAISKIYSAIYKNNIPFGERK